MEAIDFPPTCHANIARYTMAHCINTSAVSVGRLRIKVPKECPAPAVARDENPQVTGKP
jgi:hypothetical protein